MSHDDQTAGIKEFYENRTRTYGRSPKSSDYGSRETQLKKFSVLLDEIAFKGASVLEVGCGLGDFADFMVQLAEETGTGYVGVDLNEEGIQIARSRFPQFEFKEGDFLNMERQALGMFDVVIAQGVFYLAGPGEAGLDYFTSMHDAMWGHVRPGGVMAYNTLSAQAPEPEEGKLYLHPEAAMAYAFTMTPQVMLRHDYMPHDMTLFLRKPGV